MKTILISILAIIAFASCTKTLILSDGSKEKKIKVASKIEFNKDANNKQYISFESVNGTKYNICTDDYNYIIK